MGRFSGSKSASDYFGGGQKTAQSQGAQLEQQQQQSSGLRRILTLFRGSSQSRQPAEGPTGRAASSFLVSWRSTRAPADVLSIEHAKASVSFAGPLDPRWESMATDVVSAARMEALSLAEDEERARERERRDEEERRRHLQATKLQELQLQATLKERQAPRLDYQPSMNARGAAAPPPLPRSSEPALGLGLGNAEVLRLGPSAGGSQGHYGSQPLPLPLTPAATEWHDEEQQQLRLEPQPQLTPSEAARRLQSKSSKQMLLPTPPPSQKPPQQPSPLPTKQPSPMPYSRGPEPPPPQQQQQQYSQQPYLLDGNSREQLRLPSFSPRDAAPASPSRVATTAAAAAPASSAWSPAAGGGSWRQAAVNPRPSWNGTPARTAPVEPLSDLAVEAAVDSESRGSFHRLRAGPSAAGPSSTSALGAPAGPIISGSTSRRSLAAALHAGDQQPAPASPSRAASSTLHPFVVAGSPLTVPIQALPAGPASPPLELTVLSLAPAAPASPTMDIILGPVGSARVAPTGADPAPPTVMRQRSTRTLTGNGYYPSSGGLGPACLTADVALATGADLRPTPARRVSTPGGSGAAPPPAAVAANDALARRTALLREAFNGASSLRRTVQSNVLAMRSSSNGASGEVKGGSADGIAPPPAAADEPVAAPAPAPLGRSCSQQREGSAGSSVAPERPSNWDVWKHRSRETNWGLWKSQSNLSSRVRHDLESRVAEEEAALQRAGSGAGSGTNSPVPGSGSAPRWKQMLDAAAAVLDGGGSSGGGGSGSSLATVAASGGGGGLAVREATASGGGASGDDLSGFGSDRSVDGAPLAPPPSLLRAVTMRTPRAVTPAAKTGRMLLRAKTMAPTMVTLQGGAAAADDGEDEGNSSADSGPLSGLSASSAVGSPRAGRRAPAPPAPPSRLSVEAGVAAGLSPAPFSALSSAAAVASPRIAAAERARERSNAGVAGTGSGPRSHDTPFAVHEWPQAGVDAVPPFGLPPPAPRYSSPNAPMHGGGGTPPLPRHSSPNASLPNSLPPRVFAGTPCGPGSQPPASASPSGVGGGGAAAAPLAPSAPVPYRVSLMGGGVGSGIVRDGSDSGAVETPRRGSLSGAGPNPRSRRMLYVSGSADQAAAASGLVPVPPPLPLPPLSARVSEAGGAMPATTSPL